MNYKTYRYRIKDSSSSKYLTQLGYSVNFVWNYCNEVNKDSWIKFRKTFSNYELHKLTAGCSQELKLSSKTVEAVCDEYVKTCKQFKKVKLNWRSRKRSLGWIPFKSLSIQIKGNTITYFGKTFKLWISRPIDGKVRYGSFNQDSRGQWFINLVVEDAPFKRVPTGKDCGIDLGLKTLLTLSDGVEFNRGSITKKYEQKLAIAQRANKKKLTSKIHFKITNQRKDWSHKITSLIANEYDKIIVGDVSSSKLKKTKMAKSVSDAGWYDFKQMLKYKAIRLGVEFIEVNESFSTVTCSECLEKSGPRGLSALGVREWICNSCGVSHNRDLNAAKNILRFGHKTPIKGNQVNLVGANLIPEG